MSLNLREFTGAFLALGGFLFLFMENNRARGIGQALLAFAFMLIGVGLLSDSAVAFSADPAVGALFDALAGLPVLFILSVVVLTLLACLAIPVASGLEKLAKTLVPESEAVAPSVVRLDPLVQELEDELDEIPA
ncbi:hypothetical protein E4656_13430 [Natronospirillum operosum]|uniref:Uncharacterized protein n=1 Tax=Natronospirillum operosum TaxID=2759953 RepID=A0A4Z0W5V6_9GAMM|nr:hypothetical protein [Natronospirillum operosum]TGG92470.1 hypothetical protein E4656_13430 [Natronospirillum operosum]